MRDRTPRACAHLPRSHVTNAHRVFEPLTGQNNQKTPQS